MDIFYALSEPNRRNILEVIAIHGQISAKDIFSKFNLTFPAISQHLKILKEAKLVNVHKRAQKRVYELNPAKFHEIEKWAKETTIMWEQRFNNLQKLLESEE